MLKNKKVRKALIDADLNITQLALITGYSREYLSAVLCGSIKSKRAEKIISLALGKQYDEIWDDPVALNQ